jgi:signal peptidase I
MKMIMIIVMALLLVKAFPLNRVRGTSMEPQYYEGDLTLVKSVFLNIDKGDVITFKATVDNETVRLVKRVVGTPNDVIESRNGYLVVNDSYVCSDYWQENTYVLKDDEYFVVGDYNKVSYDSRFFGPVQGKNILGEVILKTEGIRWWIPGKPL